MASRSFHVSWPLDGSRLPATAQRCLDRIRELPVDAPVKLLNLCAGAQAALSLEALRMALPAPLHWVDYPVFPCPEDDIRQALHIAREERAIIATFGDAFQALPDAEVRTPTLLQQARADGIDVRPVASPSTAVTIAECRTSRPVVLLAAGCETTMAPVAALFAEKLPDNLFLLVSGRRTVAVISRLLAREPAVCDALIAPGDVATLMGPEEWQFVARDHGIPAAISGFSPEQLLAAIHSVLCQKIERRASVDNCHPHAVRAGGNRMVQKVLSVVLEIVDASWPALGVVPRSGYVLHENFAQHDARRQFAAAEL